MMMNIQFILFPHNPFLLLCTVHHCIYKKLIFFIQDRVNNRRASIVTVTVIEYFGGTLSMK